MGSKPALLLHVCCAPCATHAIERLARDYGVVLFFPNSNISPRAEYERRLVHARRLAVLAGCRLVVDDYDHAAWLGFIQGLEGEPESGKRCLRCFEFNLARTAECARRLGICFFATTLTISPHKRSADIFRIGLSMPGFVAIDFKKRDGFRRSVALSREYGLYRQRYCGCEFSLRG